MVVYLPPDDAGRDGEGKTPHPTASQTPEHLRTDSECQRTDCGHSTVKSGPTPHNILFHTL